jgi:hypothetical protein
MVGISEQVKRASTVCALEIVRNHVSRPCRFEQVLQWTISVHEPESAFANNFDHSAHNVQVFAGSGKIEPFSEAVALGTHARHCMGLGIVGVIAF